MSLSRAMNRRQFLSSLSRSALVLPFAGCAAAGTPPWKRDAVAAQQAPERAGPERSSPTMRTKPMPPPPGPASPIAGTPLGVQFVDDGNAERLERKDDLRRRRKKQVPAGDDRPRGVAFYDYDQDGWLDIFLVNELASGRVFRGARSPHATLFRKQS